MTTFTEPCRIGARLADSLPFSQSGTADQARAMKADGVDGVWGYLGVINADRVGHILDAGMGFLAVTLAGHYDPTAAVQQLQALGVTPHVSCALDLEGLAAFNSDPVAMAGIVNRWGDTVDGAGWQPVLYVGSPQPFTSAELWQLHVKRYWRGQGRIVDRHNALAEPWNCGWAVTQAFPSDKRGGVLVDCDQVQQDYLQRVPSWMRRAALRVDGDGDLARDTAA